MKCDKLNAYKGDVTIPVYGTIADAEVYLKKDVDEAIAELKQKLQDHCIHCPVKEQEDDVIDKMLCDKCRKQNGTITTYGFGKIKDVLKWTFFDLCEPCAKEIKQKIKELVNNDDEPTDAVLKGQQELIAEKDKEIAELKAKLRDHCVSCPVKMQEEDVIAEKDNEIAELKEFVQDAEYFKNLAESYHKRWLNAKKELDAYKVKEANK